MGHVISIRLDKNSRFGQCKGKLNRVLSFWLASKGFLSSIGNNVFLTKEDGLHKRINEDARAAFVGEL